MAKKSGSYEGWGLFLFAVGGAGLVWLCREANKSSEKPALQGLVLNTGRRVALLFGIEPPPIIFRPDRRHASSDGSRIVVDVDWLLALGKALCAQPRCIEAIVTWLMAHELSHHAHSDAFAADDHGILREWRADQDAGQVLASLGMSLQDVERTLTQVNPICSRSHGCLSGRVAALREGYWAQIAMLEAATSTARAQAGAVSGLWSLPMPPNVPWRTA